MQQRSEETRARILESTMKCFTEYGFNETSMQQICEDAGISKGALYHHFASKQALFMELFKGWLTSIDVDFASAQKENVPETLLHMTLILPSVIASAGDQLPMFLEFLLKASRDEEIWEATIAPFQHYRDFFENLIRRGIEEGSFKPIDPTPVADMIVSLSVGLLLQGLLDPHGSDWEQTAKASMQLILKGLTV